MVGVDPKQISVGEIFRFGSSREPGYRDFYSLTKGRHASGIGVGGKGIFNFAKTGKDGRIPAIILHSNPLKEGTNLTPWIDDINPDEGYAIYNGDNKSSSQSPTASSGNKMLVDAMKLYSNPGTRNFAPPILIFKQELINGKRKGYRSFQGLGIPVKAFTRVEREPRSTKYYTNLVFELLIVDLSAENDRFDWGWIDDRREPGLSTEETLNKAPTSWKRWVKGDLYIGSPYLRRNTARSKVVSATAQRTYTEREEHVLNQIYNYYGGRESNNDRHLFEGLAAMVAEKILGTSYRNGWITKRAGDGGIDFVGRLDVGSYEAKTSAVVLGQAKCIDPHTGGISGLHLARVAARLKRGWIGIFVTTGVFNKAAQVELASDRYPIILVNGKTLAREVLKIMNEQRISLRDFLDQVSGQFETQLEPIDAERILTWEFPPPEMVE